MWGCALCFFRQSSQHEMGKTGLECKLLFVSLQPKLACSPLLDIISSCPPTKKKRKKKSLTYVKQYSQCWNPDVTAEPDVSPLPYYGCRCNEDELCRESTLRPLTPRSVFHTLPPLTRKSTWETRLAVSPPRTLHNSTHAKPVRHWLTPHEEHADY